MKKKLVLNKETLVQLTAQDATQVAGGSTGCPSINVCSGRNCPVLVTLNCATKD